MDIISLYRIFLKNKNIILKHTAVFCLVSFFYVISLPNYYTSSISLYAAGELDDSSILGQYNSLAENFGISMTPSSNYYIPDIVDSRSLKKEIVLREWDTSKFGEKVNLIEYWEIDNPGVITKFLSFLKNIFSSKKYQDPDMSKINAAIEKLDNLLFVDEQNSGLIVVSVDMQEPTLASDISNFISQYLVEFIKIQQKIFADKSKDFIIERLSLAEKDLSESEDKLTDFRKINPLILDTPDLQLSRARLLRSVEVNQQVYITLREQLEIAKIESNKERLYINILDKGYPDPSKSKPNRLLLMIIITLTGFLISLFSRLLIINFNYINNKK